MSEPQKSAKPVSMTKASTDAAPAARPRTVTMAAVAMALAGLAALVAALALYGQTGWLKGEQIKANAKAYSSAVSTAVAQASSSHSDVAQASSSAAASAAKKYPTAGSSLDSQVRQQQTGAVISTVIVVVALGFLAFGAWRGRHWSRWAVVGFWFLASFTGTMAGIGTVLSIASAEPAAFKISAFVAGVSLMVAVVLVNMGQSTSYFALSRPTHAGTTPRRGFFAPRTPPQRPGGGSAASRTSSVLTSSAASRGEAYIQKQRAKKRASADAVARGAELARSRAKASKSRRTDS